MKAECLKHREVKYSMNKEWWHTGECKLSADREEGGG